MTTITEILSATDPVTFDGPDDEGTVHRHTLNRTRTACGIALAHDHDVVPSWSTIPLCTECWA